MMLFSAVTHGGNNGELFGYAVLSLLLLAFFYPLSLELLRSIRKASAEIAGPNKPVSLGSPIICPDCGSANATSEIHDGQFGIYVVHCNDCKAQ